MTKPDTPSRRTRKNFRLSSSCRFVAQALAVLAAASGISAALADPVPIGSDNRSEWQAPAGDFKADGNVKIGPETSDDYSGLLRLESGSKTIDIGGSLTLSAGPVGKPSFEFIDALRALYVESLVENEEARLTVNGKKLTVGVDAAGVMAYRPITGVYLQGTKTKIYASFNNDATDITVRAPKSSYYNQIYGLDVQGGQAVFENELTIDVLSESSTSNGTIGIYSAEKGGWNDDLLIKDNASIKAESRNKKSGATVYGIYAQGNAPIFSGKSVRLDVISRDGTSAFGWYHQEGQDKVDVNGYDLTGYGSVTDSVEDFTLSVKSEGTGTRASGIYVWRNAVVDIDAKKADISVTANHDLSAELTALVAQSGGIIRAGGEKLSLVTSGSNTNMHTVTAWDEGSVISLNAADMTITADNASDGFDRAAARAYNSGTIFINSDEYGADQGHKVHIKGNVYTESGGQLALNVSGEGSFLTGQAWHYDGNSTLNIGLGEGGAWNVTENSFVSTLTAAGGAAYHGTSAENFKTLLRSSEDFEPVSVTAERLEGSSGNFYLRADIDGDKADSLYLMRGTGAHRLFVRSFGAEPSAEAMSAYLVHEDTGDASFTLGNPGGYVDAGTYLYKLAVRQVPRTDTGASGDTGTSGSSPSAAPAKKAAMRRAALVTTAASVSVNAAAVSVSDGEDSGSATEWYLARATAEETPEVTTEETDPETPSETVTADPTPLLSPAAETVLAFNGGNTMAALYWGHLEDLRKRLGEVREQKEDMTGLWASAMAGLHHFKNYPGLRTSLSGFRLNVGADRKVSDTWLLGGYLRFSTGDEKTKTKLSGPSRADVHSEGLSLYATKTWDSGAYLDLVASADLFHQEVRGRMLDGTSYKGNASAWGWGLSVEAGHQLRFGEKEQWFVEPSVQLAYYRAEGNDYRLSNGMEVDEEASGGFTGRAGSLFGRRYYDENGKFSGDAYVRAGVIHQFGGGHDTVINGNRFEVNGLGTRWYAGVGGEIRIGESSKLYGYLETQHGNRFSTEIEGRIGWKTMF
ncbi:MAG: hypothetical protein ACFWTZ_00195 [Burkholderia sp.]|jgi:outer membrane autotransporter protein